MVDLPSLSLAGGLEPWPFDMEQQTKGLDDREKALEVAQRRKRIHPTRVDAKDKAALCLRGGVVIDQRRTTALIQGSEIL